MNIDKMRRQNHRNKPCDTLLSPGLNKPWERCTVVGVHVAHNWPSLPKDPFAKGAMLAGSSGRQWVRSFERITELMRGIDPRDIESLRRAHGFADPPSDGPVSAPTESG